MTHVGCELVASEEACLCVATIRAVLFSLAFVILLSRS